MALVSVNVSSIGSGLGETASGRRSTYWRNEKSEEKKQQGGGSPLRESRADQSRDGKGDNRATHLAHQLSWPIDKAACMFWSKLAKQTNAWSGFPMVRSDYWSGRSKSFSPTILTGRSEVLDGLSGIVQLFERTIWINSPEHDFVIDFVTDLWIDLWLICDAYLSIMDVVLIIIEVNLICNVYLSIINVFLKTI